MLSSTKQRGKLAAIDNDLFCTERKIKQQKVISLKRYIEIFVRRIPFFLRKFLGFWGMFNLNMYINFMLVSINSALQKSKSLNSMILFCSRHETARSLTSNKERMVNH